MNGKGIAAGGGLSSVGLLIYQVVIAFLPATFGAGSLEEGAKAREAIAMLAAIVSTSVVGFAIQRARASKTLPMIPPVSLVLVVFVVPWLALGCITNPDTGDREFDRVECKATHAKLSNARLACEVMPERDETERRNKNLCRIGADLALSGLALSCEFADEHPVPPTSPPPPGSGGSP